MEAVSTQKYLVMSPRKLRLVADMVRGKKANEVLELLPLVNKRAAVPIAKVIKSAVANARQKGVNSENLVIIKIEVNEGPRLKRFRPVSRGQAHGYVKSMSHVRVVVGSVDKSEKKQDSKAQTKSEKVKSDKAKEVKKTAPKMFGKIASAVKKGKK